MKKLLTILLCVVTFSMSAQTDTTSTMVVDNVTVTEAERIVDKYSDKIALAFSEGVQQVAPMAQDAFKMVVRLKIAEGIVRLLPLFLFFFFFYSTVKEYKRIEQLLNSENVPNHMNNEYGPLNDSNVTLYLVMLLIVTTFTFILSLVCTFHGITHIIAPEWYAIKEIIELF